MQYMLTDLHKFVVHSLKHWSAKYGGQIKIHSRKPPDVTI